MMVFVRLLEIVVGGVLIYSGLHHTGNPYQFASATAAYELVPLVWLKYLPFLLASLMICLGLCLVAKQCLEMGRILALAVLMLFTAAQLVSWLSGKQIGCGCFGFSDQPISLLSISMPVGCAAVCVASIVMNRAAARTEGGTSDEF